MPPASIGSFFNALGQIAILTAIILYVYGIIRGTHGEQILKGGLVTFIILRIIAGWLHFDVIIFLLEKLLTILALALVVIFQPELRQTFLSVGGRKRFALGKDGDSDTIGIVASAADAMS